METRTYGKSIFAGRDNIVQNKTEMNQCWDQLKKEGTGLELLEARQMRELSEQRLLTEVVPGLVQTVLDSILVKGKRFICIFTVLP